MAAGGLGAPGVSVAPPEPVREITGVRLDIAAFLGVAPRGPARQPRGPLAPDASLADWLQGPRQRSVAVPVGSWDEYRARFGGFEGPGRLPYAVAAFFDQGGRQAYVVRIVHGYGDRAQDLAGRSVGMVGGEGLLAAPEVDSPTSFEVTFAADELTVLSADEGQVVVPAEELVPAGSVLRVRDAEGTAQIRVVEAATVRPDPEATGERAHLSLERPASAVPETAEAVTGTVRIGVEDPRHPRGEQFTGVGLHAEHPRWLGRVLLEDSQLVWAPPAAGASGVLLPGPELAPASSLSALAGAPGWGRAVLGGVRLLAANEGRWGNRLQVNVRFEARPLALGRTTPEELSVPVDAWVPVGSVVRASFDADMPPEVRFVAASRSVPAPDRPARHRQLRLDEPFRAAPEHLEVVTGQVEIVDGDPDHPRVEHLADVGLRADHPRWLGRVLVDESELVWPDPTTADTGALLPDWPLQPMAATAFTGGTDRWMDIVTEDFWDPSWDPGDPPSGGMQCLAEITDVGLVATPDLFDPAPLVERESVDDPPTLAGPVFAECLHHDGTVPLEETVPGLEGLRLDPTIPAELSRIVEAQRALVEAADRRGDLTVLLDVPLGLTARQVLAWRSAFASQFAAAYHPWLDVAAPDDHREALVRLNPSAFAAGIIAEREARLGISHGPANEIAAGAVRVATGVTPAQHDLLHPAGVNVFVPDQAGIRLTGARTLATGRHLRQLTVARLLAAIRLSLSRELDWVVFEPNGEQLWAEVRRLVHGFLARLFDQGAFAGATTAESFFVRCDRTTMTRHDLDTGRLVCLVGVAPSEPLEYVELELALTVQGG